METKRGYLSNLAILKWAVLLAVVFALSLPAAHEASASSGNTYSVVVPSGYLALRTEESYDSRNEIGELYTGDVVTVCDYCNSAYWYVYSPKYDCYGYVNNDYLTYSGSTVTSSWTVSVSKGYLALRTAMAYDDANEIGQLYTGDSVEVYDSSNSTYWYVYAPKLGRYGYVNRNYLTGSGVNTGITRTVSVSKGYLALRTAMAYDDANEIGQLYTGDTVELIDTSDATYWYVYSPKYATSGYVNREYLTGGGYCYPTRTVSVSKGYLALRTARAYDESNEIGQLYSGDTVELVDTSTGTYWYVYSPKLGKYGYVNKDYLY